MVGPGHLKFYGSYLWRKWHQWNVANGNLPHEEANPYNFDVFEKNSTGEMGYAVFFYGVILTVGGLGFIGYWFRGRYLASPANKGMMEKQNYSATLEAAV